LDLHFVKSNQWSPMIAWSALVAWDLAAAFLALGRNKLARTVPQTPRPCRKHGSGVLRGQGGPWRQSEVLSEPRVQLKNGLNVHQGKADLGADDTSE
jgi:hypothetical protein